MTALVQTQVQKAVRQQDNKTPQEAKTGEVQIPESWQLTKEQQEFIELFSAEEHIEK